MDPGGSAPDTPLVPVTGSPPGLSQPPAGEQPPAVEPPPPPPRSGFPAPPGHFVYPPLQTQVPEYRVTVDPAAFEELVNTRTEEEFPAEFTGPDGKTQPILFRIRGNSSRAWPKKSFRVEFPEGVRFDGRRKLNLISSWREQTLMLEKLGYDILAAMGVPAPRVQYVRLVVNGRFQGIYLDIERVDSHFLRNHGFVDTSASIWRCGRRNCEMKTGFDASYQLDWEKKTNELEPSPELDAFMRLINFTPEPQFQSALAERFELDHFLRAIVMDALISNATTEDAGSYVIYDAVTRHFSYVPWDLNNTDAKLTTEDTGDNPDFKHPLFNFSLYDQRTETEYAWRAKKYPGVYPPIFSNLNTRIVQQRELRERVLELTEQALAELFAPEVIHARIDATYALLRPHHPGSPYDSARLFGMAPAYVKDYVAKRTQFLREEVARWRAHAPTLVLQVVDPQQGFVELKNLAGVPVETGGKVLTTSLRAAKHAPRVPARVLAPGESLRVQLPMAPEGEVGLFDGKGVVGVLDALYYGELPAGQRYVRSAEEPLRWEVR